jgi:Transposase DDE domain group 1
MPKWRGGEPDQGSTADLCGRRASCHRFQANQLRLVLAALAYALMINLRRLALKGTEWRSPARPRSEPGCSRSARPSCATRAACECCWPRRTR